MRLLWVMTLLNPIISVHSLIYGEGDVHFKSLGGGKVNNVARERLIESILKNREFGSSAIIFNEWESPMGELYFVPSSNNDIHDFNDSFELGYRFADKDNAIIKSSDIYKTVKIEEKNITVMGFPSGWTKHESADLVTIPANYDKIDSDVPTLKQISKDLVNNNVQEEGSFSSKYKRDNKLSDFNNLLFVKVANIESNPDVEKRDDQSSLRLLTIYTTTTVTSTHGVTITKMIPDFTPSSKMANVPLSTISKNSSNEQEKGITSSLDVPLIFTRSKPTNHQKEETTSREVTVSTRTLAEPSSLMSTTTGNDIHSISESIKLSTTSWTTPTAWESYPFTFAAPSKIITITSIDSPNANGSFSSTEITSFRQFNSLGTHFNNSNFTVSRSFNESRHITTKALNVSNIIASANKGIANNYNHHWGSLLALVFATVSGIFLI